MKEHTSGRADVECEDLVKHGIAAPGQCFGEIQRELPRPANFKVLRIAYAMVALALCLMTDSQLRADTAPSPSLGLQLVSKDIFDGKAAELLVSIDAGSPAAELRSVVVALTGPDGFTITPKSIALDVVTGKITSGVQCRPTRGIAPAGQHAIVATLTGLAGDKADRHVRATQTLLFEYTPEIGVIEYLILGMSGVIVGYALRLLLKAQGSVTQPPLPAPVPGGPPAVAPVVQVGPITRFVRLHYYRADLILTLLLGILVLLSLSKAGRPPQSGGTWTGALVLGAGLGLLTNNELLKKV